MKAIVLTADQQDSRSTPDAVPEGLALLRAAPAGGVLLDFERTAGDEIQGVLADGAALTSCLTALLRDGRWTIGVGIGTVETPLPESTRAGRGDAFIHARTAVVRAQQLPGKVSVVGADEYRAEQAETVAILLAGILIRRSTRGWEVAEHLDAGLSHEETGARLRISQSAVSQRASAAGYVEANRAVRLLSQLVDEGRETE